MLDYNRYFKVLYNILLIYHIFCSRKSLKSPLWVIFTCQSELMYAFEKLSLSAFCFQKPVLKFAFNHNTISWHSLEARVFTFSGMAYVDYTPDFILVLLLIFCQTCKIHRSDSFNNPEITGP